MWSFHVYLILTAKSFNFLPFSPPKHIPEENFNYLVWFPLWGQIQFDF